MGKELRTPLYDAERSASPLTVCVTGITGYVAGPLVARLLAAGHTVHGTCRDPTDESKLKALKALPGADERLKVFKADLVNEGSFDEAIKGCSHVLHTASPFVMGVSEDEAQEKLVDPALQGTTNVLNSVNKVGGVTRVVQTSSVAAVWGVSNEKGADHVFTEADWNESSSLSKNPYSYSKSLAEKKAWEMEKAQDKWTLCTVNPGLVVGPAVGDRLDGTSTQIVTKLMTGDKDMGNMGLVFSDIDDVAVAHCLCMVKDSASGRHIVGTNSTTAGDIVKDIIGPAFPELTLKDFGSSEGVDRPVTDVSKAEALGVKFHPLKESIVDMGKQLIEFGAVKK